MGSSRAQQEGRILLAIRALDDGLIGSAYEAAGVYDVPYETLRRRRSGTRSRIETRPNCLKLTDQEEDVLVQWVLDIDSRGYAPRVAELRRKANMLLAERVRGTDEPPLTVGMNWTTRFIRRRPELSAKYLRKYDYQRALCEDPKTMGDWFRLVQNCYDRVMRGTYTRVFQILLCQDTPRVEQSKEWSRDRACTMPCNLLRRALRSNRARPLE